LESRIRELGYKDMNELVRWRLYERTGGGLMAELGSHQLDACAIFLGKTREHHVRPIAVSAVGGKHFYEDDREVADHVYCTFEFPDRRYDPRMPPYDEQTGVAQFNDIVTVTYSSINTQSYQWYGEQLQGTRGSLVVDKEQEVMLFGGGTAADALGRNTAVTVTTTGSGPVLSASASDAPSERRAAAIGAGALGLDLPSKGYKEEMEHFAYCLRMRDEGMERDRENLRPRCDGQAAMDDAIIALTANIAMRKQQRIRFEDAWFDPERPEAPEDLISREYRQMIDRQNPEQV
jgi:predicted dehydrogenase